MRTLDEISNKVEDSGSTFTFYLCVYYREEYISVLFVDLSLDSQVF